jgi:hypothetical protein
MLVSVCNEITATLGRLLGYAAVLALLGAATAKMLGGPEVEAAVPPSSHTAWIAVERPHPAFALIIPEFADGSYAIQRHRPGGGRKDIMVWGEPDSPGSRLMVEIYRPGNELKHFGDPLTEVSGRASELGATSQFVRAETLDTKFGRVALIDFRARRDNRTRHCLGFVRAFDEPLVQIAGWYCKGSEEIIDPNTIACALDRLSVIAAGGDPKMSELFANAELARKFCRQQKPALHGSTLRRLDWIEAARDPKLRGRQVTR